MCDQNLPLKTASLMNHEDVSTTPYRNLPPRPGIIEPAISMGFRKRATTIYDLASETISLALQFLRATELCAVSEVDRTVFQQYYIRRAVNWQITHIYNDFSTLLSNGISPAAISPPALPMPYTVLDSEYTTNAEAKSSIGTASAEGIGLGRSPGIAYKTPSNKSRSGSFNLMNSGSSSRRNSRSNSLSGPNPSVSGNAVISGSLAKVSIFGSYFQDATAALHLDSDSNASINQSNSAVLTSTIEGTGRTELTISLGSVQSKVINEPLKRYPVFVTGGMLIDLLYYREIKCILAALNSPQPMIHQSAYWISSSWLSNARKYHETLVLPDPADALERRDRAREVAELVCSVPTGYTINGNHSARKESRKNSRIKARRGSDVLPPWPAVNADLICPHGNLTLLKNPKAKRRLISPTAWHFLRRFYPLGPTFKAQSANPNSLHKGVKECLHCAQLTEDAKHTIQTNQAKELKRRTEAYVPSILRGLMQRRSGIPTHVLRGRTLNSVANEVDIQNNSNAYTRSIPIAVPENTGYIEGFDEFIASRSYDAHNDSIFSGSSPGTGVTPIGSLDLEDYYIHSVNAGQMDVRATHVSSTLEDHRDGDTKIKVENSTSGVDSDMGERLINSASVSAIPTHTSIPALPSTGAVHLQEMQEPSYLPLLEDQAAELGLTIQELCDLQGMTVEEALNTRNDAILAEHYARHGSSFDRTSANGTSSNRPMTTVNTNPVVAVQNNSYGLTEMPAPGIYPLLPGLYNIVPRAWLKRWRTYTREPTAQLPLADTECERLLCHSHGLLVVPPHLEEFLTGTKRSLLGGLGAYEGDVVEILTAEEWETLQSQVLQGDCFSVGFALDIDHNITWSHAQCHTCDPLSYNRMRRGNEKGKKGSSQNISRATALQFSESAGYSFISSEDREVSGRARGFLHMGKGISIREPEEEMYPVAVPDRSCRLVDPREFEEVSRLS